MLYRFRDAIPDCIGDITELADAKIITNMVQVDEVLFFHLACNSNVHDEPIMYEKCSLFWSKLIVITWQLQNCVEVR